MSCSRVAAQTLQPLCTSVPFTLVIPVHLSRINFDFQLDPFYASIILFVGRAWDAVTDPTVGFLVSRSPWTRVGRMLPWYVRLDSTSLLVFYFYLDCFVLERSRDLPG